jgi:hypothetical protein
MMVLRAAGFRCGARLVRALLVLISLSGLANAQQTHGPLRGPNGGQMLDVVGIHAELVASGDSLTISVFNEDTTPVPLTGFSVMVFVNNQGTREALFLVKVSDNAMRAQASKAVTSGTVVALRLKSPQGTFGQIRFKL